MKTFLQYVAEGLIGKFGHDLSRVAVVFPNKRAALFLSDELARLSDRPVWSPAYITISELFRRHAERQVADPIKLVCDLHHCFTQQTGINETLDHFYGWGQLLLSDFDDIDKHMADADKVFANLRDLHEFDDVSFLTQEQRDIIRKFFSTFSDSHDSELKERFLKLWSHMAGIYHAFNGRLAEQQLAYEGALYREVAQREDIEFEYTHYVFVGFNMLQEVEQRLFRLLRNQGKAIFYWDFDRYYMPGKNGDRENEAGHFIAQYLSEFPNEFDREREDIYGHFSALRDIRYIAAPTENVQARYISTWLSEEKGERIDAGRRTAIVLCNEGLLQTVIHCLPGEVEKVNVTTGYPLIQSTAASLGTLLRALQTKGYSPQRATFRMAQINAVLNALGLASIQWYQSPQYWRFILILTGIWKTCGYSLIIYMCAITAIDRTLYEGAVLDGATFWQQARFITLPLLRPTIATIFILSMVFFASFNELMSAASTTIAVPC